MKGDVLAVLDRLIAATPESHHVCAPLKRSVVVAIADEIRRLRAMTADDQPKPKPQRPPHSHNTKEW